MEPIKKEYEATLFISLTHLYPRELTKFSRYSGGGPGFH